jgi:hypothetical protein
MLNPRLPGKISAADLAGKAQAEHVALARKFISLHAVNPCSGKYMQPCGFSAI